MRVEKKVARKAFPNFGIAPGDTYYEWTFFRGPTMKSKTMPTRAQLTQVGWKQSLFTALDGALANASTREELDNAKSDIENARDEAQEAFDAIPENFQQSERAQAIENVISEIESLIDAIDSALSDLPETANEIDDDDINVDDAIPLDGETAEEFVLRLKTELYEERVQAAITAAQENEPSID